MYAQTRGTTTDKGFAEVYHTPERFFPKAVREKIAGNKMSMFLSAEHLRAENGVIATREMQRLVTEAITDGHLSVTRGVSFTFTFTVSRSEGRQMLRHVIGFAWEEMSQRYVKLITRQYLSDLAFLNGQVQSRAAVKEEAPFEVQLIEKLERVFIVPPHIKQATGFNLTNWTAVRLVEMEQYLDEIADGVPVEDARENLPNCTKTQMIATVGFEALRTFLGKRLCTRAQAPVRETAKAMRKLVLAGFPWMAPHLTVHCLPSRICPESRPGDCPLLADHGGNVLRREQAQDAITAHIKTLKALA